MAFTEHYNIATEGVRAGHKRLAVLGFGFVTITIEEVGRSGGGPLGTTKLKNPSYKVYMRITASKQWWEREYIIDSNKNVNIFAKLVNTITYATVKQVYARFKNKGANQINNSNNIEVRAEFKDDTNKHKPE